MVVIMKPQASEGQLREAIREIEQVIDSGKAAEQLEKFIKLSNEQ